MNCIGVEGANEVCEGLNNNSTLTELNLRSNKE